MIQCNNSQDQTEDPEEIGEKLKFERQQAGLSQAVLAEMIGVKQQQLSQWECDKVEPTLSNIVALLKALNVTLEDPVEEL